MLEKLLPNFALLPIIFVFGILTPTILLFSSALGDKWLYSSIIGFCAIFITFATKDVKNIFICLFVFSLSLSIDVNLFFSPSIYDKAVQGLPIHASDVFFFPLLVFWVFSIFISRSSESFYFPPKFNLLLSSFLLLSFLSLVNSYDRTYAFFAWLLLLKCYLIFLFLINNIQTKKQLKMILFFFLLGASLQAMAAIAQKVTGGLGFAGFMGEAEIMVMKAGTGTLSRIGGIMGHPNKLAMFLNLFIPLLFITPFCKITLPYKTAALFLGVPIFLLAEFFTLSRSGFFSLLLGITPMLFLLFHRRNIPKFLAAIVIVSSLGILCTSALLVSSSLRQRFTNEDYGASATRLQLVKVAVNIIQHNPLLGVGLDSFTGEMAKYDTTSTRITQTFPAPVHNTFLLIAAETGIISLILFLVFLFYILKTLYSLANNADDSTAYIAMGLMGGLVSWIIHNQYDYSNIYTNFPLWIIFSLVVTMNKLYQSSSSRKSDPQSEVSTSIQSQSTVDYA